jgi:peptidoglycan/LPS O-acetylase OafA/YrhL
MDYRKDIDGLRAIAILPVILFHAGFEFFRGGFLGVDVFFVISGFLITSILLNEISQQRFSLITFYERRARRLLPALFIVLGVTYLVAFLTITPPMFKEFSQSLFSVTAFFSNYFFYTEINYFSNAAETLPLLHTWSLAIEEQYYIIFPLLLMLLLKRSFAVTVSAIVLIAVTSFMIALDYNVDDPSASFYLLTARAWEMMAGSLCAIMLYKDSLTPKKNDGIATLGVITLLASMLFWPENVDHPGAFTLIPVLGTCLIILFTPNKGVAFSFLANPFFVHVGLISYSLYLWHQPVLAFVRLKTLQEPTIMMMISAIATIFVLSILSYRFVESPFREKEKYSRKYIFVAAILGLGLFSSLGLVGHLTQGVPERYSAFSNVVFDTSSPKRDACHANGKTGCTYFGKNNVEWAVLGDSHGVEFSYAFAEHLKKTKTSLKQYTHSGCPPVLSYTLRNCQRDMLKSLQAIANDAEIKNVVLAFRHTLYLFGENTHDYPEIPDVITADFMLDDEAATDQEKIAVYLKDMTTIVKTLVAKGKRVYMITPIPELQGHVEKVFSPMHIFTAETLIPTALATSKAYYEERNAVALAMIKTLSEQKLVTLIDSYDILCHDTGCPAAINNKLFYFDDDHLGMTGARFFIDKWVNQLAKITKQ